MQTAIAGDGERIPPRASRSRRGWGALAVVGFLVGASTVGAATVTGVWDRSAPNAPNFTKVSAPDGRAVPLPETLTQEGVDISSLRLVAVESGYAFLAGPGVTAGQRCLVMTKIDPVDVADSVSLSSCGAPESAARGQFYMAATDAKGKVGATLVADGVTKATVEGRVVPVHDGVVAFALGPNAPARPSITTVDATGVSAAVRLP